MEWCPSYLLEVQATLGDRVHGVGREFRGVEQLRDGELILLHIKSQFN